MYPRTEYEMTEEDLQTISNACKAVRCMMVGGYIPSSSQENANRAWEALGEKMGFDYRSVRPISGKGPKFFTAVPSETESQRDERLKREAEEHRQSEIARLELEIEERQSKFDELKRPVATLKG